mgnify:CR=1 FL=1
MRRCLLTYGTLMRGRKRNEILKQFCFTYVSTAELSGYKLLHYPSGDYPVILRSLFGKVSGELWLFPCTGNEERDEYLADKILGFLDGIEAEGKLYNREVIERDGVEIYYYAGIEQTWSGQVLTTPELDDDGLWTGGV